MAYDVNNPPTVLENRVGDGSPAQWHYMSADALLDVTAADYVSNAVDIGLRQYDFVKVIDTTNNLSHDMHVSAVSASGAATLVASSN